MAATFAPTDAFNYAKTMVKNAPLEDVQTSILQDASSLIWMAAPWSWTVGIQSPITLVAATQDFVFTPAATYLRLLKAYINNNVTQRELTPMAVLPVSTMPGEANFCSTYASGGSTYLRLDNLFPNLSNYKAYLFYKKIAPDLTADLNTAGALIMDDSWFWVYREAVLYYAYRYADDSRAGGASTLLDPQGRIQIQYSGQLGIVQASINEMRRAENLLWEVPEIPITRKDRG